MQGDPSVDDYECLEQRFSAILRREVAGMIANGASPVAIERHLELRRQQFFALVRQKRFQAAADELMRLGNIIETGFEEPPDSQSSV